MASNTDPPLPHEYLPVGLVLTPRVIKNLLREAKTRTYVGVFNEVGGDDDTFHLQYRVDEDTMSSSMTELRNAQREVVGMVHSE
jgi:hypothetical protein